MKNNKKNRNLWYIPNLRNVFSIYKKDLKEIKKNKVLLIVIIGLTIVPSLYAWFNIKAFWDPYGSTKYLKVAVVNQDKGTEIKNQHIDLGEKVVENLKENPLLDWNFVSLSNAKKGLESGKYYAVIEIPSNFSENMVSFTKEDVKKATINYTVNEKINAIAPKITDKGASTIESKISKTLIETISNVSLSALGGISNSIGDVNPKLETMKKTLKKIDIQLNNVKNLANTGGKSMDEIQKLLDSNKKNLPEIKRTIDNSKNMAKELQSSIRNANNSFRNLSPNLRKDLESVGTIVGQNSDLANTLNNAGIVGEDAKNILIRMKSKNSSAIAITESLIGILNKINSINSHLLNAGISDLNDYLGMMKDLDRLLSDSITLIESGNSLSASTMSRISSLADGLNRKTIDVLIGFDEKIRIPIDKITNNGLKISDDLNRIISTNDNIYPTINSLLNNATTINTGFKSATNVTSSSIDTLKSQIEDAIVSIEKIQDNQDYKDFNKVIKSNILDRVEFLKDPIELNEKKIYKIENYGSAMTPFYSVLAAWVGCLILISILSTTVLGDYKAVDKYFGRMLLFSTLAILQSIVIALGNFFILGVTAKHPFMFTIILIYCSIVFVSIVYSLVSLFGTVGKGVGIFLLVIQIGGSGGTFPIQMTPSFFRAINAIIPFTYGIEACRETIGGIYLPNLLKDLIALSIFMVCIVIFSILIKDKVNKIGSPFKKMFNNSFLIGH